MITLKKYPYDPTGESENNRVVNEEKIIDGDPDRIILLNGGTFYAKNLTITLTEDNSELIYEEDYIFQYLNSDATIRAGLPAYVVIILLNKKIIGKLFITYQVVGGIYVNIHNAIEDALKELQEQDGTLSWDNIINKPAVFPPELHTHTMDDLTGVDGIIAALNSIADSIAGEHPTHLDSLWEAIRQRVSNMGHCRRAQLPLTWTVHEEDPLWIQTKPYPGAITVILKTWDSVKGDSTIEVSGFLSLTDEWEQVAYFCTVGKVPDIELALASYDGSTADLLVRATSSDTDVTVIVDKLYYHLTDPEINQVNFLPMHEYPEPIPDIFHKPVYPWSV